jgi:hypothetical protein
MAINNTPFFITGASAKIKIGGVVSAYCTKLSVRTDTPNIKLNTLGLYEPIAIVPTGYSVYGSFNIVRYHEENLNMILDASHNKKGNSIGNIDLGKQLNPKDILKYEYFDLEIYSKVGTNDNTSPTLIKNVKKCRLIFQLSNLTKKTPITESYQFIGILADDDKIKANDSGITSDKNETTSYKWVD